MFRCAPEFFKQVLETDCDDFLYYPKTSVQWKDLHKVYRYVDFDEDLEKTGTKTVRESLKSFMDWLLLTKATISMHSENDSGLRKLWSTIKYGTYYMFSKKSRIQKCKISVRI